MCLLCRLISDYLIIVFQACIKNIEYDPVLSFKISHKAYFNLCVVLQEDKKTFKKIKNLLSFLWSTSSSSFSIRTDTNLLEHAVSANLKRISEFDLFGLEYFLADIDKVNFIVSWRVMQRSTAHSVDQYSYFYDQFLWRLTMKFPSDVVPKLPFYVPNSIENTK